MADILKREIAYDDYEQMDSNPNANRNFTAIAEQVLTDVNEGEPFVVDNEQYIKLSGKLHKQVLVNDKIVFVEV